MIKSKCILLTLAMLISASQSIMAQDKTADSGSRIAQLKKLIKKYDETPVVTQYGWAIVGYRNGKDEDGRPRYRRGIVALDGTSLLPCQYDFIIPQRDCSLVIVIKDTLMGIVNSKMEWLLPTEYCIKDLSGTDDHEYIHPNGMLSVSKDGHHGLIDTNGNWVMPCIYDHELTPLSDKLIATDSSIGEHTVRCGLINYAGDTILPFKHSGFGTICDGRGSVTQGDKVGYIDENGEIAIPLIYEQSIIYAFSHGMVPVREQGDDGKWGVIDTAGQAVAPFQYDLIKDIGPSGLIIVQEERRAIGAINRRGEAVIPCEYSLRYGESSDRIALRERGSNWLSPTCSTYVFDTLGNILDKYEDWYKDSHSNLIAVKQNGLWGFLDTTLRTVIPCKYRHTQCTDDYGNVELDNGNYALLNRQGDTLAQGPFFEITPAGEGLYHITTGPNRYQLCIEGYMDSKGNHTFTKRQWKQIEQWWKARILQKKNNPIQ